MDFLRKFTLTFAAFVLLLSFATSPSHAAVKPGTKCTKQGQTSTSAGIKYTCVKSGNKLVWNKGVSVKAAAKPELKPVFEPAEPTSTPTPTPKNLSPLEKMNRDIYARYVAADKKISPSFNFVRCPNVNKSMADITETAYIDAYSFWATVYKATAKINWLLMSEKDWDCWYETTAKFEGPNPVSRSWNVWNKSTGVLGHCPVSSTAFCGYGTGVREGGIFAQYNLIGTNYKIAPDPATVHHETVHNYQAQLIADNYATSKANTVAPWFMEGQANLFGAPISAKGDPTTYRNFEKGRLLKVYPKGASYTKEEWTSVFVTLKNDPDFVFKNELGYSLGWFALEWTYMNYTIEEMHTFLELMVKGSTWEQAIQAVMKMDEQAYYAKLGQYFADEF